MERVHGVAPRFGGLSPLTSRSGKRFGDPHPNDVNVTTVSSVVEMHEA
jgi:hypothetical protein